MVEALIAAGAAIIVGALSLIGVIVTNNKANNKMQNDMKIAQAVTDTKLDNLAAEVHTHNNFAQRIPALEEQQTATNRRLKNLETAVKPVPALQTSVADITRRLEVLEEFHRSK